MMVFRPPKWVPPLPSIPDCVPVCDFLLDERYGRRDILSSYPPLTCGVSGREYSVTEVKQQTENIASALAAILGWNVDRGSQWEKVIGTFAFNSIDTLPVNWAIHRLNGIVTPANPSCTASELAYQLDSVGAKALFTCISLLSTALEAADKVGIKRKHIFLLEVTTNQPSRGLEYFASVSKLVAEGQTHPELKPLNWAPGQARTQVAFLCYSSGTSGLPKGVMISHFNIIANIVQVDITERDIRRERLRSGRGPDLHVGLCILPLSHIYALVAIVHTSVYRGDKCVILPKFDLTHCLQATEKFEVSNLYVVPPIILRMLESQSLLDKYDLGSISDVVIAAAPLGKETALSLRQMLPNWKVRQAYGLTESCVVASITPETDISPGSSGCLISGYEAKLFTPEGLEITSLDIPGELYLRSPSITSLGYFKNERATRETFSDGSWLRTGDEAMFRLSENGDNEHLWITDRIKEMIKVNGFQVAPSELESYLLTHTAIADVCVIPIQDPRTGEAPKAFIVKTTECRDIDDVSLGVIVKTYVQEHKARHKWLKEVEFVQEIPKSRTGKILRRVVRDWEKGIKRDKRARL